jgi:hypothetical protein
MDAYDILTTIGLYFLPVIGFTLGLVMLIDDRNKRSNDTPRIQSSEHLITLDEVAENLGVDRMTVYYRLLSVSTSRPRMRIAVNRLQLLRPHMRINFRRHNRRVP